MIANNLQHTPFNKVSSITDGDYNFTFQYNSNHERVKMEVENDNETMMTKYYFGPTEIQETSEGTRTINHIGIGTGLLAMHVTNPNGSTEIIQCFTDRLGSPIVLANKNGHEIGRYSYTPWGKQRDPYTLQTISFSNQPVSWFHRGYTGHEMLYGIGIINMNGRIYDPHTHQFLSPDNYIQAPGFSQSFNRFAYCWNNPLVYTDPSGDFLGLAIATWLLFTESGYEVQKYVSPVAVKLNVHFGSEQRGIGADVSVGVPKIAPLSYRAHGGATYYWQHYDDSYTGWETRYGGEWTLGGLVSYSGTTFNSGGTSQTTNIVTIGGPFVNLKYENDYMFGIGEYLPGVPAADGGDRYRTAAARLKVGPFTAGVNMFTGDPGLDGDDRIYPEIDGRETYAISKNGDDPNKYRSGFFLHWSWSGKNWKKLGKNKACFSK